MERSIECGGVKIVMKGGMATVSINGASFVLTCNNDIDKVKEPIEQLVKKIPQGNIFKNIFPSWGKEFKISLSRILKA